MQTLTSSGRWSGFLTPILLAVGCSDAPSSDGAAIPASLRAVAGSGGFAKAIRIGAPITVDNLTVFPLALRGATVRDEYLTLDETLRAKQLSITEERHGGVVDSVEVENRGDRPVLVIAGELLVGGKQDRIVARSVVVGKRSRSRIPVFCMEHGRWMGSATFASAEAMGHADLRRMAISGDQREVWMEVARSNARLGTANSSEAYRPAARRLRGDADPLVRRVLDRLALAEDATGVAVAVDGEIVAVEWFGSRRIFARLEQKLLSSYAAQALASAKPVANAPPREADVLEFMERAERGEGATRERVESKGQIVQSSYIRLWAPWEETR